MEDYLGDFDADMEEENLLQFNLGDSFSAKSVQPDAPSTAAAASENDEDDLDSFWNALSIGGAQGRLDGDHVGITKSPTLATLSLPAHGGESLEGPTDHHFDQENALRFCVDFMRTKLVELKVVDPELWVPTDTSSLQALERFGGYLGNRHIIIPHTVPRRGTMNTKKVIILRSPLGRKEAASVAAAASAPRPVKRRKSEGSPSNRGKKVTSPAREVTISSGVVSGRTSPLHSAAAEIPLWKRELDRIFAGQELIGSFGVMRVTDFHSFLLNKTLPLGAPLQTVWWHRVLRLIHNDAPYAALTQVPEFMLPALNTNLLPLAGEVQCQLSMLSGASPASRYFLRMCKGDPWSRLVEALSHGDEDSSYIGASMAMVGSLMSALLVKWWQTYGSDPAMARAYIALEGHNPRTQLPLCFEQTAARLGHPDLSVTTDGGDVPYLLMVPDSMTSACAVSSPARAQDYLFVIELCYRILMHVESTARFHEAYP